MKVDRIFPSKDCHCPYDHIFLFSREMGTLERTRRYICKNLLNLDCQDSIRFDIYLVHYK